MSVKRIDVNLTEILMPDAIIYKLDGSIRFSVSGVITTSIATRL